MGAFVPAFSPFGLAVAVAASHPVTLVDGRVRAADTAPMMVGEPGEVSVTLLDRPHPGTPISLELSSDTVGLPDNRLGWDDVVDPQADQPRFRARVLAPTSAGEHIVRGRVQYVTCAAERCRPRWAFVQWTLVIEPVD